MNPAMKDGKITFTRGDLSGMYGKVLKDNQLLFRLEMKLLADGWTKEEILMAQLIVACESNRSMLMALAQQKLIPTIKVDPV